MYVSLYCTPNLYQNFYFSVNAKLYFIAHTCWNVPHVFCAAGILGTRVVACSPPVLCVESEHTESNTFTRVSVSQTLVWVYIDRVTFSLSSFLPQAPCENLRTPSTYPGNMLPHHPGQANFEDFTCWADLGEASKCVLCNQNQPYNKNYIQHGECEELTQSRTEALFTWKGSKVDKSDMTKNCHPRPSGEDIPNIQISVNFPESISRSTLNSSISVFFSGILPQRMLIGGTLPTRTSLSKDEKKQNVKINKGTCTAISP